MGPKLYSDGDVYFAIRMRLCPIAGYCFAGGLLIVMTVTFGSLCS